jgi:flagellar hook-associated protein 3 FlgL
MSIPNRVSDQTLYTGLVGQYDSLLQQQTTLEGEISSGVKLQSASQDPVATALSQEENTLASQLTQDQTNISQASSFAAATENSMNTSMTEMQQAAQLVMQANDGTMNQGNFNEIADEVDQMLQGMLSAANSQFDSKNLFGGSSTNPANPPFVAQTNAAGEITSVTYTGNQDALSTVVAPGTTAQYNLLGNGGANSYGVFQDSSNGGFDMFNTLIQFRDDLQTGNTANFTTDYQNISDAVNHLSQGLALTGSAQQFMQNQQTQNQSNITTNSASLNNNQSTDMAQAITQLNALQTSYEAALKVGAQITQESLLNYVQ